MSVLGRRRTPVVVGHRGGRGPGWPPENTLASFDRARLEGAHAVELDVRSCASGEAVVFHDPTLTRMTGGADTRPVARVPWSELRALPIHGSAHRIPSLAEALAWASSHGVPLNVEIKHDVPWRLPLARAVSRALADARVPVIVSSFDPLLLVAMGALLPRVPRALLTDRTQRYSPLLHRAARAPSLYGLHVERSQARPEAVQRWKRRGLRVGVWTVNDADEARALAGAGVDLVITDRPEAMVDALSQWLAVW